MAAEEVIHETTYRKRNLVGLIHRNRLQTVRRAFERHVDPGATSWADFGCSNGFMFEEILAMNRFSFKRLVGIDSSAEFIEMARAKRIPNAEFRLFSMNTVQPVEERFDVVTCLETLEHVLNVENALANLVASVNRGGLLMLTVPNEVGIIGFVKLVGRAAVRRNPYGTFFANGRRMEYVTRLLTYRRIDGFRGPAKNGYGPHLGFDYRTMEDHITGHYVTGGVLSPPVESFTVMGMNVLLVYRRTS